MYERNEALECAPAHLTVLPYAALSASAREMQPRRSSNFICLGRTSPGIFTSRALSLASSYYTRETLFSDRIGARARVNRSRGISDCLLIGLRLFRSRENKRERERERKIENRVALVTLFFRFFVFFFFFFFFFFIKREGLYLYGFINSAYEHYK